LDLTVTDPEISRPLYELFLTHMGYREVDRKPNGGTEWDNDADGFMSVGIARAKGPNATRGHDRYSAGLHHAAWAAPSREDVDKLYSKLKLMGAKILDPPADYPEYNKGRGYYAVFFADPDGLKLEYVWTP
jgi:catechol 2,3-dioxygenase-like lactoylglutathione lyase family enzyme